MLVWDFIAISPHEQIDWRDRVYAMHVQVQEQHQNAALEVLLKIYDSKAKTQFPLHRKYKIFPNAGDNAMSVSGKCARTQAAARAAQKQLKQTMKTFVWEQAIANLDSSMIAGGPSLRCLLSCCMHPEDNVPLFLSVDAQPKTENSVIACFKAENSALCLELCTRIVPFLIKRYGPNAEAPFFPEFVAAQKEAFVTTPTGIKSRSDLAMERPSKDFENLEDVPIEEDPSYRVLIADIRLHVPAAH